MDNADNVDERGKQEFKHFIKENHYEVGKTKQERYADRENFRHRFLHTVGVCSCFFALGWRSALLGPTLPDLKLITDTDLSTISWIFTANSIGGLVGSICGGFAYDRLNKIGLLTAVMALMGIFAGVVPWCNHIVAMMFAHAVFGVVAAGLNIAASADMTAMWKPKAGPFMQALHGSFSIGAILSPLVCEPFLAKKILQEDLNSTGSVINSIRSLGNISTNATTVGHISDLAEYVYGETRIYIPYIISMSVCLMMSLYFMISLVTLGDVYKYIMANTDAKNNVDNEQYFLSHRMKAVFTILLAVSMTIYSVSEFCVTGFLVTFLITDLRWSKTMASNAMSIFWVGFASGRLMGIFTVKKFRTSTVLITFFSVCITGVVLLWTSVVSELYILVWISIAIIGYGLSVIMPSMYTWLSENVRKLTSKVSSIMYVFISIGNMTLPLLVGNLMAKFSQMWLIYSAFILFTGNLTLFIFILALFKLLKTRHSQYKGVK